MLLLELLIVIMIIGVLITGAVRTWDVTISRTRFNETVEEMDELVYAIIGNPNLYSEGRRTDFGFVGDMGRLPNNLTELVNAPAGATTWQGPYVKIKYTNNPSDYLQDAWGMDYVYNRESLYVQSYGGGSNQTPSSWITKKISYTASALLRNSVTGQVLDLVGNPPGSNNLYLTLKITYPLDGILWYSQDIPDENGFYNIPDIPQGNHQIVCIYDKTPATPDTTDFVEKIICVYPGRTSYIDFRLTKEF